ncbi:MAG: alkaline phosphatase D family protein, partial [Pseudobdellovibrionaceae bacterium]
LNDISPQDLKVRTMPKEFDWDKYRYDFLLLSCNNPDQSIDKMHNRDGYEVWQTLPSIINSHETGSRHARVLFALMGGDQVYADEWKKRLLESNSVEEKVEIYFEVYEHYWSDPRYKKILAGLPAYLMWDDHDILDGWGSETSSFIENEGKPTIAFKPEWKTMFVAAKRAFRFYQAARNPDPLVPYSSEETDTFDVGFTVGPLGFIMADLRSNRNWQAKAFWNDNQIKAVEKWIQDNRKKIEVLFFLTPVVIAHGSPLIEEGLVKNWDLVLKFFKHARDSQKSITPKGIRVIKLVLIVFVAGIVAGLVASAIFGNIGMRIASVTIPVLSTYFFWLWIKRIKRVDILKQIELIRANKGNTTLLGWLLHLIGIFLSPSTLDAFDNKAGDLSDDIRDSWGGEGNEKSVEHLLQMLFDLQNDPNKETCVHVAILSGDIHAGGYSNIYSSQEKHNERPVIPHIVSSPVGYSPFPWFAEAFYRKFSSGSVPLGLSSTFYTQNSHHFTERNIVICSVRKFNNEKLILKTKFYVEGFSEPQTTIFDLDRVSHRENIKWVNPIR